MKSMGGGLIRSVRDHVTANGVKYRVMVAMFTESVCCLEEVTSTFKNYFQLDLWLQTFHENSGVLFIYCLETRVGGLVS